MANLQLKTEKSTFEKFYQGWPYFTALNIVGDTMIFSTTSPAQAVDSYLKAQQRINELCLPLEAKVVSGVSNNFIVKGVTNGI